MQLSWTHIGETAGKLSKCEWWGRSFPGMSSYQDFCYWKATLDCLCPFRNKPTLPLHDCWKALGVLHRSCPRYNTRKTARVRNVINFGMYFASTSNSKDSDLSSTSSSISSPARQSLSSQARLYQPNSMSCTAIAGRQSLWHPTTPKGENLTLRRWATWVISYFLLNGRNSKSCREDKSLTYLVVPDRDIEGRFLPPLLPA